MRCPLSGYQVQLGSTRGSLALVCMYISNWSPPFILLRPLIFIYADPQKEMKKSTGNAIEMMRVNIYLLVFQYRMSVLRPPSLSHALSVSLTHSFSFSHALSLTLPLSLCLTHSLTLSPSLCVTRSLTHTPHSLSLSLF